LPSQEALKIDGGSGGWRMDMPPWQYEPARDLDQPLLSRLKHFPRQPDMLVYGVRSIAALIIRGWLRVYHRFNVVGRENLPTDRSFVLVANHNSHLDTLCLLSALPLGMLHRAFPAAARDYFFVGVPGLFAAAVVANALPFDRRTDIRESLTLCRELLENPGNALLIFPEGTRSATGEVGEFKAGIGLLTAAGRHPVVPCYLQGSEEALPKGSWFPRPRRLQLIIGKPRTYLHLERTTSSAHLISQELRQAVLALAPAAPRPPRLVPRQEFAA
jgi:1-acyl-sn-glycerol-3-phosphate acyltransferase